MSPAFFYSTFMPFMYREIEKKLEWADQTFQLAICEISINRCQS
jgi:hypothetical protein